MTHADLRQSNLRGANLSRANLLDTQLEGAALGQADLTHALFMAQGLPDPNTIAGLRGVKYIQLVPIGGTEAFPRKEILEGITKPGAGIQSLRQALQTAGETEVEKEVGYLIAKTSNTYRTPALRFLVSLVYEWPSDYGTHPQRPLRRLLELTLGCALLYLIPLAGVGRGGVNRLWIGAGPLDRLKRKTRRWRKQRIQVRGFTLPGYALLFSLASVLLMGGHGLPLFSLTGLGGRRPYSLRPTGWVTIASGIQSILSLYLIGTWAWLNLARFSLG